MLTDRQKLERLMKLLHNSGLTIFEYYPEEDRFVCHDDLFPFHEKENFSEYLRTNDIIHPEDCWKVLEFLQGNRKGPVEIREMTRDGKRRQKIVDIVPFDEGDETPGVVIGTIHDVTVQKSKEMILEEQVRRDAMTGLYNHASGKQLIDQYLAAKDPYASCGFVIIDIDYFKNVNDSYGHLFGDRVLIDLANLFKSFFEEKDIIVRAGGDEFVIFLKDITHTTLIKKCKLLSEAVRALSFDEPGFSITCSMGVCFLPENVSGYSYEQLFENADWALYGAKEKGKNRYEFCDSLRRFRLAENKDHSKDTDIDGRYFHNDIVSTAFEIFEKSNDFNMAITLLLRIIGIRFQLDRITVIRTDIKDQETARQYQWVSEDAPEVLQTPGSFEKEDFLTLFQSYDEYGTTVLQHDNMDMYSPGAAALLMQGEAKTIVYAAMYCEGKYTGAISYVVCKEKRFWSRQIRSQLGEVTKIISAHLAKNQTINASHQGLLADPDYDGLTGLLSYGKFREEIERRIVGSTREEYVIIYSDFDNFTNFNVQYSYNNGDQLLKRFSGHMAEALGQEFNTYFTRVVSDQFILFLPYEPGSDIRAKVEKANESFLKQQTDHYPNARLQIRSGIYIVPAECVSAVAAIDAANYARKQAKENSATPVLVYDEEMEQKQTIENRILAGMNTAMEKNQFKIYLQPRVSLKDHSVVGAEALVRWQLEDGTILLPDAFIPLYEKNNKVIELDFYVFEKVAEFLEKNERLGRKQVPISVNASILHASYEDTVERYLEILNNHGVNPELTEIELTESGTVSVYDNVCTLFQRLQNAKLLTSLDDFGAGYSLLNTVIDIPVDTIKIDRSLMNHCVSSKRGIYFLERMILMVKGLGYRIVCEGVETEAQAQILASIGCDEAQGYRFAHPLTIEEYEALMYQ